MLVLPREVDGALEGRDDVGAIRCRDKVEGEAVLCGKGKGLGCDAVVDIDLVGDAEGGDRLAVPAQFRIPGVRGGG